MIRASATITPAASAQRSEASTPELQQADNDYAVGLQVQAVANSPYAKSTLIFILEDDSQDGADYVDSHRARTYVVGPYVEHRLGAEHINLNTYYTRPMADVFDITSSGDWTFTAVASTLLKQTTLGLGQSGDNVRFATGPNPKPTHNAKYSAAKARGFDFSGEDHVPRHLSNKILWEGLKGTPARVPDNRFQMIPAAYKEPRPGRRRRQLSHVASIPARQSSFRWYQNTMTGGNTLPTKNNNLSVLGDVVKSICRKLAFPASGA